MIPVLAASEQKPRFRRCRWGDVTQYSQYGLLCFVFAYVISNCLPRSDRVQVVPLAKPYSHQLDKLGAAILLLGHVNIPTMIPYSGPHGTQRYQRYYTI